jgi:N-acyl-D-amino-acid deacylase
MRSRCGWLFAIGATASWAAVGATAPIGEGTSEPYDIVIRGGSVLDGTGAAAARADIAIRDGHVVSIGLLSPSILTHHTLDATGLTVAPGFIDVHSHAAEGLAGRLGEATPLLAQGVTTVFINPDGGGPVDLAKQRESFEARGVGVNIGQFVPHGSIREQVIGLADRPPTDDELARMERMVGDGMKAGGLGLSTGLYYAPGSYAKTEEIVALAKVAAELGGVYSSHVRDEADYTIGVVAAVDEVIRISEEAHIRAVVSHMKALGPANWGKSTQLVDSIERARARGLEVYADQYAYEASGTSIVAALSPRWAEAGGRQALLDRLNGADAARVRAAITENIARRGGAEKLVVSDYAADHALESRSLAEIAHARSVSPVDLVVTLLQQGDASLVSFNMSDDDIVRIMRQPWTMTCSDGELTAPGQGKPHPRGYGAFARKLAAYVRDRHVIDLPDAVRSMTSLPAMVFGLRDRGVLRDGAVADIVVLDPAQVQDRATYQEPQQIATGVRAVVVNGVVVMEEGAPTGKRAGRWVRPERR